MGYRIGIIGPESVGKSTLARYLAKRYHGTYVPEYAREYVEQLDRECTYQDVERIARHQIEQLQHLDDSQLCFFDTELIVTKVWFEWEWGRVPDWLNEAIEQYRMDVYLLVYPDIEWQPDPARTNGSDEVRLALFARYEQEIQALDTPYYIIKHC